MIGRSLTACRAPAALRIVVAGAAAGGALRLRCGVLQRPATPLRTFHFMAGYKPQANLPFVGVYIAQAEGLLRGAGPERRDHPRHGPGRAPETAAPGLGRRDHGRGRLGAGAAL